MTRKYLWILVFTACADEGAGSDPALPCGEDTVASVTSTGGSRVDVCVFDDGVELVGETAPLGRERVVPKQDGTGCALDAYLEATGEDVPVPQALVDSCRRRTQTTPTVGGRLIVAENVFDPPALDELPVPRSSYCGTGGAVNFQDERCPDTACPGTGCSDWCTSTLWGWHDRNMAGTIGDEGDFAEEIVASCNGATRFRTYSRDDVGDAWILKKDVDVLANYWYHVEIWGYVGLEDGDFRFRGDSYSGASHRHSGRFSDY